MTSELRQVKQMIRSIGVFLISTYSQTLNGRGSLTTFLIEVVTRIKSPSGPFLVSRIGDAGCTESGPMVPKHLLIRSHEGRWFI